MTVNKLTLPAKDNAVQSKVNDIVDELGNKLQNTATGTGSLAIASSASSANYATKIGIATAVGEAGTAIGYGAGATQGSIQIGYGSNNTTNSFSVGFNYNSTLKNWIMLNGYTGLIPDARISANIARTSQIPSISNLADKDLGNLSATGQAVIDGKADTSLSNITNTAKIAISHNAMPSARYIGLNLLPSGDTYTAPSDGWIYISGTQFNSSGYVFVENVSNGLTMLCQPTNVNNFEIRAFIPVAKGQTYRITYADIYVYVFRFIYNIGSESEAS